MRITSLNQATNIKTNPAASIAAVLRYGILMLIRSLSLYVANKFCRVNGSATLA